MRRISEERLSNIKRIGLIVIPSLCQGREEGKGS
jgi:hypothetical protein